jgi:hypothetical protein
MMNDSSNSTTSNANVSGAPPAIAAESRQIVLKEIRSKWNKFSERNLWALKNRDDVISGVVTKYGLEKAQVERDVDALLKGGTFKAAFRGASVQSGMRSWRQEQTMEASPMVAAEPFDYDKPAELFPPRTRVSGRQSYGYMRFDRAADAIRFAIERLPPKLLLGACLEIDEVRIDCRGIRCLYASVEYPFLRCVTT